MDNTIENAKEYLRIKGFNGIAAHGLTSSWMVEWGNNITADKNRHIAELEKDAVLSADAIGLLQHDNARLEKEISDLRRALSECKAKARIGISPENR